MYDPFDGRQYAAYLFARWRLPAAALGVALAAASVISLLLPRKYTAEVSLLVEPPAGGDPRVAAAVSPIYLESLKTYEHFALSGQLFGQAVKKFNLRRGRWRSEPIETLKESVLRVSMPHNTKVLVVSATLPDPELAHALASYIAGETVKLNRETNRSGAEELLAQAREDLDGATARVAGLEKAYYNLRRSGPSTQSLRAGIEQLSRLQVEVSQAALDARLSTSEQADARARALSLNTNAERLRLEAQNLEHRVAAGQEVLAGRTAELEAAAASLKEARSIRELAEKHLLDVKAAAGMAGERLVVLDPGVVPERPSSPNIPLNLVVAGLLALILSWFYLTLRFGVRPRRLSEETGQVRAWTVSRS